MPIVSNAGNKQVNVGKMQIKGQPWQPPTGQLHSKKNSNPNRKCAWRKEDPWRGSHGDDPPNDESPST